jgi:hypothetical protein
MDQGDSGERCGPWTASWGFAVIASGKPKCNGNVDLISLESEYDKLAVKYTE